jgi:hypothetical protein
VALFAALLTTSAPRAQSGWVSPVGIPAPPFGLTEVAPAAPNPWTTPQAGFYHVNATHALATDTNNPYGSAAVPRRTIPTYLPAGSVVELHGTYSVLHRSPAGITMAGTQSNPVFIRGRSAAERPLITQAWEVYGSYFVMENLHFHIDRRLGIFGAVTRGVLRHSEVRGTLTGGGVAVGGSSGAVPNEVLIYKNSIHDNGDYAAPIDQDMHGIVVSSYVSNLWILENEFYRNSGDGVQINAGNKTLQPTTHHIYLGRNVSHHNKQTGMWTKQANDVVFSENLIYGHRPGNSSYGACTGFQYAPERVWYINNHLHDCEMGIAFSSNSDLGTGQYAFVIGNVIHNIHNTTGFNSSAWGQSAIMMAGGVYRYIANNTIYDVDAGIQSPGGGAITINNNIVANVTQPAGNHINIESAATAGASYVNHNLLGGTARIKWGSGAIYNVSSFLATFGKGVGNINAEPIFVNIAGDDFKTELSSPSVDRGLNEAALFAQLKALMTTTDLDLDPAGVVRGFGSGWDIGAFERGLRVPLAPTNVHLIR